MVLGTFIVSFIGNSFVQNAQEAQLVQSLLPTQPMRRQVLVLLYFFMILGIFTLLGVLTIPDIAREGADFVNRLQSDNIWVRARTGAGLGAGVGAGGAPPPRGQRIVLSPETSRTLSGLHVRLGYATPQRSPTLSHWSACSYEEKQQGVASG